MDINSDGEFCAEDKEISEQKPSVHAISYIMSLDGLDKAKYLYIGNSNRKDRQTAALGGIDYIDVKEILK